MHTHTIVISQVILNHFISKLDESEPGSLANCLKLMAVKDHDYKNVAGSYYVACLRIV